MRLLLALFVLTHDLINTPWFSSHKHITPKLLLPMFFNLLPPSALLPLFPPKQCRNNPEPCDWFADAWTCLKKGEQPSCERYYEASKCPDYCEFDKRANQCHAKGQQVDCMHYYQEEVCASEDVGHCEFDKHAHTCKSKGE